MLLSASIDIYRQARSDSTMDTLLRGFLQSATSSSRNVYLQISQAGTVFGILFQLFS